MLKITQHEDNIYHIEIKSPRLENDPKVFYKFLCDVVLEDEFGIILEVDGEKNFNPESKKDLNLWFKSNKELLGNKCKGFLRVKTENFNPEPEKIKALEAAFPCPYGVFDSVDAAKDFIKNPRLQVTKLSQ